MKHKARIQPLVTVVLALWAVLAASRPVLAAAQAPVFQDVPGVVIDHIPASAGIYIGSPSIAILPNGDYVASHDHFGPKSTEHLSAVTAVFRSSDRGHTWKRISQIQGQFWSTLFVHRGALYIIGPDKHHGNAIIRRSPDWGVTWTSPTNSASGLLRDNGQYHCAPMPVIEHAGRLWRGMERRDPPKGWGITYCAGMLSVPVDADLLDAANWTFSNFLPGRKEWLEGRFNGWLEGNAVVTREGRMLDILRVDTPSCPEKAAMVRISSDGRTASFDPENGFIDFPGGAKKFSIRYDAKTDLYWSVATMVPVRHQNAGRPGGIRNTLALTCSKDLTHWTVRCILLYHPDIAKHGFQYVAWQFEGDDIIAACRTAYDDGLGGAHNNHDANFLTFHRLENFRSKTMADSAPMPERATLRHNAGNVLITGHGFEMARLANGGRAFSNRTYIWQDVPARFRGWRYARTGGGERAEMKVKAQRDTTLHVATVASRAGVDLTGWTPVPETTFFYTDGGRTKMSIWQREATAGEEVFIPQGNWTGGLLLLPGNGQ